MCGGLYARDVLDQRTRGLCALASLAVIGRHAQIRVHILAALRAGATRAEIQEVVWKTTSCAGLPASLGGLEVMEQVWRDLDAGPDRRAARRPAEAPERAIPLGAQATAGSRGTTSDARRSIDRSHLSLGVHSWPITSSVPNPPTSSYSRRSFAATSSTSPAIQMFS